MILNRNVQKKWGSELWVVNHDLYCGKILTVNELWAVSYHFHKIKHETFHIIKGKVYFKLNGIEFLLIPGDTVVINPEDVHSFGSIRPQSTIIEFSTQHFEEDSYRHNDSHPISPDECSRWVELPLFKYLHRDKHQCNRNEFEGLSWPFDIF